MSNNMSDDKLHSNYSGQAVNDPQGTGTPTPADNPLYRVPPMTPPIAMQAEVVQTESAPDSNKKKKLAGKRNLLLGLLCFVVLVSILFVYLFLMRSNSHTQQTALTVTDTQTRTASKVADNTDMAIADLTRQLQPTPNAQTVIGTTAPSGAVIPAAVAPLPGTVTVVPVGNSGAVFPASDTQPVTAGMGNSGVAAGANTNGVAGTVPATSSTLQRAGAVNGVNGAPSPRPRLNAANNYGSAESMGASPTVPGGEMRAAQQADSEQAATTSQASPQQSLYFFSDLQAPYNLAGKAASQRPLRTPFDIQGSSGGNRLRDTSPVRPPFGAVLPIRTLGAIYTLRSNSRVRLALTRDVRGQGWSMKRGTVLVGTVTGGESNRAYVTVNGFIDPGSGQLVQIEGEAEGVDGGAGLRGQRKHIGSRWAKAAAQIPNAAVALGTAYLGRRAQGSQVFLPGAQGGGASSAQAKATDFVVVKADTLGYVQIVNLPNATRGVDPEAVTEEDAPLLSGSQLSEAEMIELMTTATPEQIQAALPRMNPQMRQLALKALEQP